MYRNIVIGGGGIIAIEMACNMCEILNKRKVIDSQFKGSVKLITSGNVLCPTHEKKYQVNSFPHIYSLIKTIMFLIFLNKC